MSTTRELRLFISSTFRDMQVEREHLVKKIFPEIRALCRERGVTFTEIDLRWGITDEEARRGQVVRICLEEIDRCRPYFLGILGSRYGWQPGQDILDLDPGLAEDFPWVVKGLESGLSVTDIEFLHGALEAPDPTEMTAWFYRRDEPDVGSDAAELFTRLLNRVQTSGHPLQTFTSPEELGTRIRADLLSEIDRVWPAEESPSAHETERRSHQAFARSRLRGYLPRPDYTDTIVEALGTSPPLVLLHGPSGLGKSALLAASVREIRSENPDCFVVEYFVGAGRMSRSAVRLMQYVMHEIEERFGSTVRVPTSPDEVAQEFPAWLFRAGESAAQESIPFVIAIDGLNQLDSSGGHMSWLPRNLPENLHLLLSTTPGEITDRLSGPDVRVVEVEPLENPELRRGIILNYLAQFRKRIPEPLIDEIMQDPKGDSPLYLRLLAEQLRQHGSHETLQEEVRRFSTAPDLDGAFERRLEGLENDFGAEPVELFFSALYASREGLTETELLEITGLPRLTLSPILFALDFNVLQGDGPLRFGHDYLRRAVERHYMAKEGNEVRWHIRLARYFQEQPPSERTSGELAWQFREAGETEDLIRTLTTIDHFLYLYRREKQLEVMMYWSPLRDEVDVAGAYEEGLRRWRCNGVAPDTEIDALGRIADLLMELGDVMEAERFAEERRRRAVDAGNRSEEAQGLSLLALLAIRKGEYEKALRMLDEGRVIFEEIDDSQGIELCIGNSAQVYLMQGRPDAAREALAKAAEIAERHDRIYSLIRIHGNLGISFLIEQKNQEAMTHLGKAVDLAREIGDYRNIALGIGNMGHAWLRQHQYVRALECFREDERESRRLGDLAGVSRATANIASALIDLGRYGEAAVAVEEQLGIDTEVGDRAGVAVAFGHRGVIEIGEGHPEKALASFREGLVIWEQIGNHVDANMARGNIALTHGRLGEHREALDLFAEATEEARKTGDRVNLHRHLRRAGTLILDLMVGSKTLPDYLDDPPPDADDRERRLVLLDRVEQMAGEIAAYHDEQGEETPTATMILIERIACERALLNSDRKLQQAALNGLTERLSTCTDDPERAELHEALFAIAERHGDDLAAEHYREAVRLYTALHDATPTFEYREALERLREAASI